MVRPVALHLSLILASLFLAQACTVALGTLTLTPTATSVSATVAGTDGIDIGLSYSGEGFDPAHCDAYMAVPSGTFVLTETHLKQPNHLILSWPGALGAAYTNPGADLTVRIKVVYTVGQQSVSATTTVTITPSP